MKQIVTALAMLVTASAAAGDGVGMADFSFDAPHQDSRIGGAIWYPASEGGVAELYGDNPVFEGVLVKRDADLADGMFPAVLLSQRLGGNIRTFSWLAVGRAARGPKSGSSTSGRLWASTASVSPTTKSVPIFRPSRPSRAISTVSESTASSTAGSAPLRPEQTSRSASAFVATLLLVEGGRARSGEALPRRGRAAPCDQAREPGSHARHDRPRDGLRPFGVERGGVQRRVVVGKGAPPGAEKVARGVGGDHRRAARDGEPFQFVSRRGEGVGHEAGREKSEGREERINAVSSGSGPHRPRLA